MTILHQHEKVPFMSVISIQSCVSGKSGLTWIIMNISWRPDLIGWKKWGEGLGPPHMTQHKVPSKSCPSVSGLSFSAPLVWDTHLFICAFWVSVDMWAVLFVALLLQVWTAVTGYPSGAPVGRCEDMTPRHGVPPQSIPSPYTIVISNITFSTNQTINGNLKRCDFLFYLLQH